MPEVKTPTTSKEMMDYLLHRHIVNAMSSDIGRALGELRRWELENACAVGTGWMAGSDYWRQFSPTGRLASDPKLRKSFIHATGFGMDPHRWAAQTLYPTIRKSPYTEIRRYLYV